MARMELVPYVKPELAVTDVESYSDSARTPSIEIKGQFRGGSYFAGDIGLDTEQFEHPFEVIIPGSLKDSLTIGIGKVRQTHEVQINCDELPHDHETIARMAILSVKILIDKQGEEL